MNTVQLESIVEAEAKTQVKTPGVQPILPDNQETVSSVM